MESDLRPVGHARTAPLILGREREQAELARSIDDLFQGRGSMVVVSGEAGIGKTTLVRHAATIAHDRGTLVLTGGCYEYDLPSPYALWRDTLKRAREQSDHLQSSSAASDPFNVDDAGGASELHAKVYSFFSALAVERPIVLLLEDLQWADEPSLDLLRFFTHQRGATPFLLIITCRADDLNAAQPLYRYLPILIRESRPLRLSLRPLSPDSIAELVRQRFPTLAADDSGRLAGYLDRYGEGNPFFIEELLGMLEYQQVIRHEDDGLQLGDLPAFPVPPLVRQVIHARLEHLGEESLTMLEIASVIGVEIPLDLWREVSQENDDVLAGAIEEAMREGAIEELPGANGYRFRHVLIHGVVYERPAFRQRREWHRRTAELLAERPNPDPSMVAHHLFQAGDDRAATWLIEAGRQAARSFALRAAAANYERALEILEQDRNRHSDRTWLLCALAETYRFTDVTRALAYVNRAFEALDQFDDPAMRALCSWCRARIRGFHGENVLDDLREAAAAYAALSTPEQDRILQTPLRYVVSQATLSQDLALDGQFNEARDQALAFLERNSTPASRAGYIEFGNAHFGLALAYAALGEPDAARVAFEQSRDYFQRTENSQMVSNSLYWELNTVAQIYDAEQPARRAGLREAEIDANRSSELVGSSSGNGRVSTSDTAILDGMWDECRASASARLQIPASRVPSARKLAHLDWLQGHPQRAWEHVLSVVPQGPDEAPGKRFFLHRHELQWIAAELALDQGDLNLARRWIEAIERWLEWSGKISGRAVPELLWSRYHELRADLDGARRHAKAALEFSSEPRQPLWLLAAHRDLARIDHLSASPESADAHIEIALQIAIACGAPYELALTRALQAELLLPAGQIRDAQRVLTAARQTAERLDARPLLARIDALMELLGKPAADDGGNPFGLSPREMEVLRHVVQGMTDARIAEELSISRRTVGGHLQSIFNKTGTSSRTAVTALAYRHGMFSPGS